MPKVLFGHLFSVLLSMCVGGKLLAHVGILCLAFWWSTKLFSTEAGLFYIPTSNFFTRCPHQHFLFSISFKTFSHPRRMLPLKCMNDPPLICSECFMPCCLITLLLNLMKNCSEAQRHVGLNWILNPWNLYLTSFWYIAFQERLVTIRITPSFPLTHQF